MKELKENIMVVSGTKKVLFCFFKHILQQGFWRGNVPALLMVMPYTAIQFTVLHRLKTLAAGSSKSGTFLCDFQPMHFFF